ncbi:MAG: diguanylate cyclase [Lachnospiraceae bacterium]|nr:diguanylate cyclase [Lachnospiraceae bacterium]
MSEAESKNDELKKSRQFFWQRKPIGVGSEQRRFVYRFAVISLFFIVLFCILTILACPEIPQVLLDDRISTDLYHVDGTVEHFSNNVFTPPEAGAKLVFTIRLPEKGGTAVENPALCFANYNSVIHIFCDGKLIYSHGDDLAEKGHLTGHTVVRAVLPANAAGPVTVEMIQGEPSTTTFLRKVKLLPARYAWLYPLSDGQTLVDFALFICAIFAAIFVFGMNMVLSNSGDMNRRIRDIAFTVFSVALILWAMAYEGSIYFLASDRYFFPNLEYISLYILAVAFTVYLRRGVAGLAKKVCLVFEIASIALCAVVFTLQIFAPSTHPYTSLLSVWTILVLPFGVFFFIVNFTDKNRDHRFMKIGLAITVAGGLLEVFRVNIERTGLASGIIAKEVMNVRMTPYIVLALEITLTADNIRQSFKVFRHQIELYHLRDVALRDPLTGLRNRRAFEEGEKALLSTDETYTVAFIDADGLKRQNDAYGHDAGDDLLQSVGMAIDHACVITGTRGYRIGGDEFVITSPYRERVDHAVEIVNRCLEETKAPDGKPYTVSVGIAEHRSAEDGDVDAAIRLADDRMYDEKVKHHRARQ